MPSAQSNISIRTDEFTCVVVTVYPDEQAAEAGLEGVAEWRDHHPEILESAEDNFYLEGVVTNFIWKLFEPIQIIRVLRERPDEHVCYSPWLRPFA